MEQMPAGSSKLTTRREVKFVKCFQMYFPGSCEPPNDIHTWWSISVRAGTWTDMYYV